MTHPTVARVTARIEERSKERRARYLEMVASRNTGANIGIVTAFNDMLSAHQPYGRYPEQMKIYAREVGATAQVAGGTPAMCDGVTQGKGHGAVAVQPRHHRHVHRGGLSHAMFEGVADARHLRQDRARPVDGRAALRPPADHLRALRPDAVRAFRTRKSSASASSMPRARSARDELLEARSQSYHSPGTCTFYGTANSNQMMMELMGLHMPQPPSSTRARSYGRRWTRAAVHRLARHRWAARERIIARSATVSTRRRSSTLSSACWQPAARPTTQSTCPPWRARPGSCSTGKIWTGFRRSCH
jgi:phosphogluconate dehydratase